jgi:hypothetical protein
MHPKEERFKMLLELYLSGKISLPQQDEFFDLVNTHQFDAFLETKIGDDFSMDDSETKTGLPPHIAQEIMRNILSAERMTAKIIPARKNYQIWYGLTAAAVIIALVISWFLYSGNQSEKKKFASTIPVTSLMSNNTSNMVKVIVLDDGSRIELQPHSVLHYPSKFSDTVREVYLEGQAFFKVTHNPSKPFLVYGDRIVTKVLGTSFFVNTSAENGTEEVSVRTGRVRVSENNKVLNETKSETAIIVTPNQKAVYEPEKRLFETKLVDAPLPIPIESNQQQKTSVVQDRFNYEHEKLETIFKQLQDTYGIEIVVENPALNNCVFTGNVTGQDLFAKLKIVCIATGSSYQVNGTKILISGQGCNQ